jgi:hypothetical protein
MNQILIKITEIKNKRIEFESIEQMISIIFPEFEKRITIGKKLKKSEADIIRTAKEQIRGKLLEYINKTYRQELEDHIKTETNLKNIDKGINEYLAQKELTIVRMKDEPTKRFDFDSYISQKLEL